MGTFRTFEDIEAWQLARKQALQIKEMTRKVNLNENRALVYQINRSAGSAMDNIAEGFERGGNKEFIQFLSIAKGSNGEVRSQLYRFLDFGLINEAEFNEKKELNVQVGNKTGSLTRYLKNSERRGYKFEEREVDYEGQKPSTFN